MSTSSGSPETTAPDSGAASQQDGESEMVVTLLFPGVVMGRTTRVAPVEAEIASGGWYVQTDVARHDIMRAAKSAAAYQNKAQRVHDHPQERTTRKGKIKTVKCNEGCVLVQPDVNYPGGSMGGRQ